MTRQTTTACALVALLLIANVFLKDVEAFSTSRNLNRITSGRHQSQSSSKISMYVDGADAALTLTSPLLSTTLTTAFTPGISMVATPTFQAEVMKDMARIALDITPFFGPATLALRTMAVVGQILNVVGDYVPDHAIAFDDCAFQLLTLGMSTNALLKSAQPLIASATATTEHRDVRSYHALFSPAGVSWNQYRSMIAADVISFVDVNPDSIIASGEESSSGDNLYWLYNGEAQVQTGGNTIQTITRKTRAPRLGDANFGALIGGMPFARRLDNVAQNFNNRKRNSSYSETTVKAGKEGATLLRINRSKLMTLMDNDEQLDQSIRSMLFAGMQETMANTHSTFAASPAFV